jgi:hypothetical protein
MSSQSKPSNCKPHNRTRVVLDESEIQRRLSRPKRPTLAERYAQETDFAERNRFYSDDRTFAAPQPNPRSRPDQTVWVTRPILKARGWTDTAIREFLPAPECHRENPHPQARRPMPLWRAETVAKAESDPVWQHWLRQSLARRRVTLDELLDTADDRAFLQRVQRAGTAIDAHRRTVPDPVPPSGRSRLRQRRAPALPAPADRCGEPSSAM